MDTFLRWQRGFRIPSSAAFGKIGEACVQSVHRFAEDHGFPWFTSSFVNHFYCPQWRGICLDPVSPRAYLSRGPNLNGASALIVIRPKSGWGGLRRKLDSLATTALGTCRTADLRWAIH